MMAYNGLGYPMTPVRKNKMSDDIVEKIIMKGKAAEEIRLLREENDKLRKALAFIQGKAQETLRPTPFQDEDDD